MQNGKCTICGFKSCADGKHSYDIDTKVLRWENHVCQICGYVSDCVDADKDCVCDLCGSVYIHVNGWSYDAERHWLHCEVCEGDWYHEGHVDDNEDGKCDVCEYNMNGTDDAGAGTGTGGDDSGLDNVPKTGDVSILVMGAMVLLFGTGAVLAVKKYAI